MNASSGHLRRPHISGTFRTVLHWLNARPRRALLAGTITIVFASVPMFMQPFLNDDATYTIVAQKLNTGHLLYKEAVDNKPPLIYYTFATILRVFGQNNLAATKAAAVAANLACLGLVFAIGRRLVNERVGAIAAILFAAAIVTGIAKDSIAPNTEIFMNLFVLLSLWWVVPSKGGRAPSFGLFCGGICASIATLYRFQGAGVLVGIAWILLVDGSVTPAGQRRRWWVAIEIAIVCVGFFLPLILMTAYFAVHHILSDALFWTFEENMRYLRSGNAEGINFRKVGRILLTVGTQFPVLLAGVPAWQVLRRRSSFAWHAVGLFASQIVVGVIAYQMGQRFYGHYFVQVIPFAALLGACGISGVLTKSQPYFKVSLLMGAMWAGGFGIYNMIDLAGRTSEQALALLSENLRANTEFEDQVLLWGASPLITLWSGRDFATRFPFNNAMTGRVFGTSHALSGATRAMNLPFEDPNAWRLFWTDMAERPPAAIADAGGPEFGIHAYQHLAEHVRAHYNPGVRYGDTTLYFLRR